MNKITVPVYSVLGAGILFSLLQISFHLDISLLAFPLSAAMTFFMVWFVYLKMYKAVQFKAVLVSQKLLQYAPYVYLASFILRRAGKTSTPYAYDVITVLLWAFVLGMRYWALYYLNDKRVYALEPSWKTEKKSSGGLIVKPAGKKRILFEIVDWVDALVQAVFMVLIFQIFVLQLYVIPSESMVPSFLIGDRVVVFKTPSGPKMPLSDVGFPCLKKYKRGDVVVFRNPHYRIDRKSEVRTVVSQLVYMLTFSTVNLNVDEFGEPKADPLVKRVTGLPGEQLVMLDGVLYSRTKNDDTFKAVEADAKFAKNNLNNLPENIRRGVEAIPLSSEQYDKMLLVEQERDELDVESVSLECASIARDFSDLAKFYRLTGANSGVTFDPSTISLYEYDIFANFVDYSYKLLDEKGGSEWFSLFMTDWVSGRKAANAELVNDMYAEANYRLNLMVKLVSGRIMLKTASLIASGKSAADIRSDETLAALFEKADRLNFYMFIMDQRNMPVFPANLEDGTPQYIPSDAYFMMGDNRFNSLDMRHSYSSRFEALTSFDKFSATYRTNMAPQYVSRKFILGKALYRFWPLSRRGVVKTN